MQYLIKIESLSAPRWRLIALDGSSTLAAAAELMAQAFGYGPGARSFTLLPHQQATDLLADGRRTLHEAPAPQEAPTELGRKLNAGESGLAKSAQASAPFDSLNLEQGMQCLYAAQEDGFKHRLTVMKKEEHLFCLMPSCLVGLGLVPPEIAHDEEALRSYAERSEAESLDLRECTKRMRAFAESGGQQGSLLSVPFASA